MKKTITSALLASAALLACNAAMAQIYVSGAVGAGHVNADCTGISQCDNSGTAAKLTAGYAINDALAVEFGYINFGKVKAADSGVSISIKPTALTLGLAYTVKLSPEWAMDLRGGAARVEAKVNGTVSGVGSGSFSETKTEPYVGLGLGYVLNPNLRIEAGADFSRSEIQGEKANVRALTIGARWSF